MIGGMKVMLNCRAIKVNVKRALYEGVSVPTAPYGAWIWSMAVTENNKFYVIKMCLRNMCGVTHMDWVKNEVFLPNCNSTRLSQAYMSRPLIMFDQIFL